jgi:hypothetical protein
MKWLDNWIQKKARQAWENSTENSTQYKLSPNEVQALTLGGGGISKHHLPVFPSQSPGAQSINFQIYPATGGYVVEIHFAEPNTYIVNGSMPQKSLHIIPSDKDLGEAISKIITLEMLKK